MTTLGETIRAAREAAGMTQEDLATRVGVQKFNVSVWERDVCAPQVRTLKRLADALGMTTDELLAKVAI